MTKEISTVTTEEEDAQVFEALEQARRQYEDYLHISAATAALSQISPDTMRISVPDKESLSLTFWSDSRKITSGLKLT